jgi:hypothetical protein
MIPWEGSHQAFRRGPDRGQSTLFPACLDKWTDENNYIRVIDASVDMLDLAELRIQGVPIGASARAQPGSSRRFPLDGDERTRLRDQIRWCILQTIAGYCSETIAVHAPTYSTNL